MMNVILLKTMILSEQQAKNLILQPKSSKFIESVKLYESALRVFTEDLDEDELKSEVYWTELTNKLIEGKF